MSLPTNNKESKDNKPFDYNNNKFSYLVELQRDCFAVEPYKYSSTKKISNVIYDQIKNNNPIIIMKCSCFQMDKSLLLLMHSLSDKEIEKSLLIALEISFNYDLSKKKILIEHDYCISAFW